MTVFEIDHILYGYTFAHRKWRWHDMTDAI